MVVRRLINVWMFLETSRVVLAMKDGGGEEGRVVGCDVGGVVLLATVSINLFRSTNFTQCYRHIVPTFATFRDIACIILIVS